MANLTDDHRAGKITVNLMGRLNKWGGISPRYDGQLKYVCESLSPHPIIFIVLTILSGIMDHEKQVCENTLEEKPWDPFF